MDKRYQVFVSSTYADLKDERSRVIQTLMEMDCIPSGMELFPAMDEEQFEFIKRIIDDCDYYLLIIGGRYGSTTAEGMSYTEKEYDYAIEKNLKVLAFIHQEPDNIPVGKTDKDPALALRLENFKAKVQTNRLVKYWKSADELPGLVSLSLSKTIKTYPAVGWVRGGSSASTEILEELNNLRKLNDDLRARLDAVSLDQPGVIANLAGLDDHFEIFGRYKSTAGSPWYPWKYDVTFGQLFSLISPHLLTHPSDGFVEIKLKNAVLNFFKKETYDSKLDDQVYQTIKLQFKALGLVELRYAETVKGGMALFWALTKVGESTMTRLRVVLKPASAPQSE